MPEIAAMALNRRGFWPIRARLSEGAEPLALTVGDHLRFDIRVPSLGPAAGPAPRPEPLPRLG